MPTAKLFISLSFIGLAPLAGTHTAHSIPASPEVPAAGIRPSNPPAFSLDTAVASAAREHNVDATLIRSIIAAESGFQSGTVSESGAVGLMQVMPGTAEELGYDAKDKKQNILAGSKYLSVLLQRYRDKLNGLELAIAAYNAGPGNVDRYGGVPPFRETQAYVKRVLAFLAEFRAAHHGLARVMQASTRVYPQPAVAD